MVALACWLLMPRFVQLDTLSSPSGLGTLKSLPIGFCVFRRMDTGDAMLEFGMFNDLKREMHLPFMIGKNSCYLLLVGIWEFYPYPDWSSSRSKFSTNHKMSTIWIRATFVYV